MTKNLWRKRPFLFIKYFIKQFNKLRRRNRRKVAFLPIRFLVKNFQCVCFSWFAEKFLTFVLTNMFFEHMERTRKGHTTHKLLLQNEKNKLVLHP